MAAGGEVDDHAVILLLQACERDTAFHRDAEATQLHAEDALGVGFADRARSVSQVTEVRDRLARLLSDHDRALRGDRQAHLLHGDDDPHLLEDLERAGRHGDGAAIGQRFQEPVDDARAHSAPCQFDSQRQPGRPGPDDQNTLRHASPYRSNRRQPSEAIEPC
jgi:enoyl-CoA hydratase/carnithine racemase